jgi:tetratricopeptide (TPR) repeat protein
MAAAGRGEARRAPRPPAAPPPEASFWRDIVEPNAERVQQLLNGATTAIQSIDSALANGDADWAVDQQARIYEEAYQLLRKARALHPQNVEVLALLGRVADELGKTAVAIEALEACIELQGPERAGVEVTGRLGAIYLRMGRIDAAIRWLRHARGPLTLTAPTLVHLANALAARGEMIEATDTLARALPATWSVSPIQEDRTALVLFGLAVLHDRDEQRAAAFSALEKLQTTLQQQYAAIVRNELARMRFAPAEDQHYYLALLYESLGYYVEARAEWAHYAAIPDAAWRRRALEHIAEIDRQRRSGAVERPTLVPPPPNHVHVRPHP